MIPLPPTARREAPGPLRRPLDLVLCLVCLAVFGAGCAPPWGTPRPIQYQTDAVRMLMMQLQAANAGLTAFKGRGHVTAVADDGQRMDGRSLWAAAEPGRLRFAFLAPTGQPVFSMSCDEEWVTALNHGEGDYYRRRVGDNSLSGLLPVPVRCADLFGLLKGRPPHVDHDAVLADPGGVEDPETMVLVLKRRYRGTVGRIRVDRESGDLRGVELLDVHGNLLYDARLADVQVIDGYRLPTRIHLRGPDGAITLSVQRIWPEASLDQDIFRIAPP